MLHATTESVTSPKFLLPLLLALVLPVSSLAQAPYQPSPATVHVSATGTAVAPPTSALLSFAVTVRDATVSAARESVAARVADAVHAVLAAGVESRDVRNEVYHVHPVHEWRQRKYGEGDSTRVTVGYEVSSAVGVTIRDLDKVSAIVDAVINAGGNDVIVNGVTYQVENTDNVELLARKKAMEKAKAQAEALVEAAGAKLGRVMSINTYSNGGGMQYARGGVMMDMAAAAPAMGVASNPTPSTFSAGEMSVQVTADVVFEINND